MLVLALDTATPAVTTGVVELGPGGWPGVRGARVVVDARQHAELLVPLTREACADAGVALSELDAVVVGVGPGPFTGLRVGIATAAAFADALGLPMHPVCSLDAIAAAARAVALRPGPLLVVTDARRREVYWAIYDAAGRRSDGPDVLSPAALADRLADPSRRGPVPAAVAGDPAVLDTAVFDVAVLGTDVGALARLPVPAPTPAGLVAVAADRLRAGAAPDPVQPLYLRRPDATPPAVRKRVSP